MIFELYLSTRFFRKRLINFLAIGVVAFSVLMPIVVLAVMEGFGDYMKQQIRGALSDVIVGNISIDFDVENPRELNDRISSLAEVAGSAPFIRSFVIVKNRSFDGIVSEPALIQGFDPEHEYRMFKNRGPRADLATQIFGSKADSGITALTEFFLAYPVQVDDLCQIEKELYRGDITGNQALDRFIRVAEKGGGRKECERIIRTYDIVWDDIAICANKLPLMFADTLEFTPETVFGRGSDDEGFSEVVYPEAFLRTGLAHRLGIRPGGTFVIAAVTGKGVPVQRRFRMKGSLRPYSAAKGDRYDMPSVVIPFKEADLLFDAGGNATGISVWFKQGVKLWEGAGVVQEAALYSVHTWTSLRYNILRAVENENRLLKIVLLCIGVAGGFAILAIIYTSVSEKVKDIGILKAVGVTPRKIVAVFMGNTVIIGLAGTALGVLLAFLVVDNINWLSECIGWTPFSEDIYYLPPDEPLPVSWEKAGVWFFSVCSFVICILAGLYPALRAASLNAADSIRND